MLIGIDHVLVACADPDAAAAELETSVGLRAGAGGRHEAHGTFNRLVWLGNSYVELMGVFDRELAEKSWWGRVALTRLAGLSGALSGAASFLGLVLASDDLAADSALLRSRGARIGEPHEGSRVRADGATVRWWAAHIPAPDSDIGLLFLIQHDYTAAEWTPTDLAERAALSHPLGGPARLERVEVPVASVSQATMRVHRDVGVAFRPSLEGGGARDGAVGRQTLRLFPAQKEYPPRLMIRGGYETRDVLALGCAWQLVPGVPG